MNVPKILRVGTRDSLLALAQTKLVTAQIAQMYPEMQIELVPLKTTGDLILDKALDKIGGKGLFVKELDHALIEREIDISVSSLKDLPVDENAELPIILYIKRADPRDALVLPRNSTELYTPAKIGTGSARRIVQLAKIHQNATFAPVRGNIITRLKKLDSGEYSALILAAAGLQRANLAGRISTFYETNEVVPAAGQGTLAVQARADFDAEFLKSLDDEKTRVASLCERSFVRALDGGCSAPIGAYAVVDGGTIKLDAAYTNGNPNGALVRMDIVDDAQNAEWLGAIMADKCLETAAKMEVE